jgi:hypothetical protein
MSINNIISSKIFVMLATALATWLVKSFYDKLFRVKPRIFINVSKPEFRQENHQYSEFIFSWKCIINLKNNSKYPAYNIAILFPDGYDISEKVPSSKLLKPNFHLDSHQSIEVEVETTVHKTADEYLHFEIDERGNKIYKIGISGTKFPNKETLKPQKIENIKLLLKYESELGKQFYTLFEKKNELETNRFQILYPYLFMKGWSFLKLFHKILFWKHREK